MKLTDAQKAARATRRVIRKMAKEPERCHPSKCPLKLWDGSVGSPPECGCGKCDREYETTVVVGQAGPQDLMDEGEFSFKDITYSPTGKEWKMRIER